MGLLSKTNMSVGAELREARERHGVTLQDISARTKISVERLAAIEEMDGAALPSLVYLQGYLKAYAAEVQLDPHDVVERYLDTVEILPSDFQLRPAPVIGAMDEFPSESQVPRVDQADEVKQVSELEPASNDGLEPASDRALEPVSDRELELTSDRALESASDRELAPASDRALEPASDGLGIDPEQAPRPHDETVAPVPVAAAVAKSAPVLHYDEPDDAVRPNVFAVVASTRSRRAHRHARRRVSPMVIMVALAVVAGFLLSANIDKIEQRFPLRSTTSSAPAAAAAPSTISPGDEARPDRVSPPDATRADGSDAAPTASPSTTAALGAPPEADVERVRGGADGARTLSVDDVTGTLDVCESRRVEQLENLQQP